VTSQGSSRIFISQLKMIMKLQELKQQIIDKIGILMTGEYTNQFTEDINKCNNGWDILNILNQYGYDTQGSLDILFSILIY